MINQSGRSESAEPYCQLPTGARASRPAPLLSHRRSPPDEVISDNCDLRLVGPGTAEPALGAGQDGAGFRAYEQLQERRRRHEVRVCRGD